MRKNDLIEDVSLDGKGIVRYDGVVMFVPHTAVGDRLVVKVLKVKKIMHLQKLKKFRKIHTWNRR